VVVLQLLEVLAHVARCPGVISGDGLDELKVRLVGVDSDKSVVGGATSQSTSTRVQRTLHGRTLWWVKTGVLAAIDSLVGGLVVTSLSLLIGIVLDEEVPAQVGVF